MPEWIQFNILAVEGNVPNSSGIYMIADTSNRVIYVGKSTDLLDRLSKHVSGESEKAACLQEHGAATFAYEECLESQITDNEEHAIGYYEFPVCNERRPK